MEKGLNRMLDTQEYLQLQNRVMEKRHRSTRVIDHVVGDMWIPRDSYHNLLLNIMREGQFKPGSRTGTHSISIGSATMSYFLGGNNVVAINTKAVHTKSVLAELEFFLKGITNNNWLKDRGVTIWSEWEKEGGDLGPIYGSTWRDFGGIDQLETVFENLQTDPFSRRHVVSAWNPPKIPEMALPPCHVLFQFDVQREVYLKDPDAPNVGSDDYVDDIVLNMSVYQRSMDVFLGGPFNLMSYSVMLQIFAECLGYKAGTLNYHVGDAHIYENHFSQVELQLIRHHTQGPSEQNQRGGLEFLCEEKLYPWQYTMDDYRISVPTKNNSIIAPVAV